jgi:hypothetical protein
MRENRIYSVFTQPLGQDLPNREEMSQRRAFLKVVLTLAV